MHTEYAYQNFFFELSEWRCQTINGLIHTDLWEIATLPCIYMYMCANLGVNYSL